MKLDPESEQIKEVYARYGLAMYQAQCLERQVAILLSLLHADPTKTTRLEFNHLLDSLFEQTLGALREVLADLDQKLHGSLVRWNGDATRSYREAHDQWQCLRGLLLNAHRNYGSSLTANLKMWDVT